MNAENVNAVADAIEQHKIEGLGFNMSAFVQEVGGGIKDHSGHPCDTVACIAGWAAAVAKSQGPDQLMAMDWDPHEAIDREASTFLGIDVDQEHELFFEGPQNTFFSRVLPEQAVKVLRHLAATGEVDWSVAE